MDTIDQALEEIGTGLEELAPELEGLRDYARLNLKPETKAEIERSIGQFQRRESLLKTARAALTELRGDGFPEVPVRQLPPEAYADLVENARTIQAALAMFSGEQAATLNPSAGAPEPKA